VTKKVTLMVVVGLLWQSILSCAFVCISLVGITLCYHRKNRWIILGFPLNVTFLGVITFPTQILPSEG
jgi:hypothetical protein